jgi:hypothetical protein
VASIRGSGVLSSAPTVSSSPATACHLVKYLTDDRCATDLPSRLRSSGLRETSRCRGRRGVRRPNNTQAHADSCRDDQLLSFDRWATKSQLAPRLPPAWFRPSSERKHAPTLAWSSSRHHRCCELDHHGSVKTGRQHSTRTLISKASSMWLYLPHIRIHPRHHLFPSPHHQHPQQTPDSR